MSMCQFPRLAAALAGAGLSSFRFDHACAIFSRSERKGPFVLGNHDDEVRWRRLRRWRVAQRARVCADSRAAAAAPGEGCVPASPAATSLHPTLPGLPPPSLIA